jgi:hypothetical protein
MRKRGSVFTFLLCLLLTNCMATTNSPEGFSGGFNASAVGEDGFYVVFRGNGFTTPETIQTYFLYNVSLLVLQQGYDGFETSSESIEVSNPPGTYLPGAGFLGQAANAYAYKIASGAALYDNIRLLKKPLDPMPPKVFDAALLKTQLEPIVNGMKCRGGNVCPHAHHYLYPSEATAQ